MEPAVGTAAVSIRKILAGITNQRAKIQAELVVDRQVVIQAGIGIKIVDFIHVVIKSQPCRQTFVNVIPESAKKFPGAFPAFGKQVFNITNGNIDTLGEDEELLKLAKQAGCVGWLVGFESINQDTIESIGKKTNKVEKYKQAIEKIHKNKMMVQGSFVFGFDHDTLDIFEKTFDFVESAKIDMPDAMLLTPFPGSPLFNRLEKENRILTKNWALYDYRHVVFQPKHMTPEELYKGTRRVVKEFHRIHKMLIRWTRLPKLSFTLATITSVIGMDVSRKIWYKRDFGI